MKPKMSIHFQSRKPSAIRLAQIEFSKRKDNVAAINTAVGNVSLATHPAMQKRLFNLKAKNSPFKDGVIKYSATAGFEETNKAFLNIITSSGFKTKDLYSQITDGGSQGMELIILGLCGAAGKNEKPLLVMDPTYTNYKSMADRLGRKLVSINRILQNNGKFTLPKMSKIEKAIKEYKPAAILVIPYDNPTGQFYDRQTMIKLAKLCVKYNLWMISDEAYRELYYVDKKISSIWGLTEKEIPGIKGRRISIETVSKVWNSCGLRIGAIITDNKKFHEQCIAENTANLCSSVIGQYIFGALANEKHQDLKKWYSKQRNYYQSMLLSLTLNLKRELPNIIVSSPDASIYSVVGVRNIVKSNFDALDFVLYCAKKGKVKINGKETTLLVSPMSGFYNPKKGDKNMGKTQMRIAYVETPDNMKKVPYLFAELFKQYQKIIA